MTDSDHDQDQDHGDGDGDGGPAVVPERRPNPHHQPLPDLGHFSISLSVADLEVSRDFYERLGMEVMGGDGSTYLMLRNPRGGATIGLFHGLFDGSILTFNPGLDPAGEHTEAFDDVRDLEARWRELGLEPVDGADPASDGPAHVTLEDPDGNAVLVDQFWPRPS